MNQYNFVEEEGIVSDPGDCYHFFILLLLQGHVLTVVILTQC